MFDNPHLGLANEISPMEQEIQAAVKEDRKVHEICNYGQSIVKISILM